MSLHMPSLSWVSSLSAVMLGVDFTDLAAQDVHAYRTAVTELQLPDVSLSLDIPTILYDVPMASLNLWSLPDSSTRIFILSIRSSTPASALPSTWWESILYAST